MNEGNAKTLSLWLGIAMTFALGVKYAVELKEAATNGVTVDTGQDRRIDSHEARLQAIERDSSLLVRMTALEGVVAAQTEQIRLLREELSRERRRR